MSFCIINKINKHNNLSASQCNPLPVQYTKTVTGANNPTITKSIRLSEYLSTNRYKQTTPNTYSYLDNRGLVFTPVHQISPIQGNTEIIPNTYIKFPYEKIFITSIQKGGIHGTHL